MSNSTTNEYEVAIHTPGKGWTRKTFKTEAALDRYLDQLDSDCEVRFATE